MSFWQKQTAAAEAAAALMGSERMRERGELTNRKVRILLSAFVLSAITATAWAQPATDFSGLWEQDNGRCQPKRNGDVTLRIEQHDPDLTVETSMSRNSGGSRHAIQKYTTDGKVSISTGADGDEFHTSIARKDSSLVFSIEEHEDGHILQSTEKWSVIEDGATLERIREHPNGEKQTLLFRRIPPSSSENKTGFVKARDK